MRSIAIGAALSGALALAVASTPAAQADEVWGGDTTITSVTVNGGKPIVVGVSNKVTFSGSVTATDPDGIEIARVFVYHGGPEEDDMDTAAAFGRPACTAVDAATKTCVVPFTLDPGDLQKNTQAGQWNVGIDAFDKGNGGIALDVYKHTNVQRYSKLSVNASPEPVAKGKSITVTGKLTRANWETHDYRGYTDQPVKLQFRKAGTNTYTTVKTVYTNSTGSLKTTATAAGDGYWRYYFSGTSTTATVKTAGDYVDVR
ncbi:calcium-binding protein [Streptomyces sp. NPDC002698]|uniref:calcium-binding protein n=1 Tax=Streptomyces sp. NPDC002698 TaxID=3364660 RepID=UPI0036AFFB85